MRPGSSSCLLTVMSGGFSPAQLPNLAIWLDASNYGSLTFNGGDISQWNDLSANGNHIAQGTASAQPTYEAAGINGKPALDFDNTDFLTIADNATLSGSQHFIVAVVKRVTDTGAAQNICGKFVTGSSQREYCIGVDSGDKFFGQASTTGGTGAGLVTSVSTQAATVDTAFLLAGWTDGVNNNVSVNNANTDADAFTPPIFDGTSGFYVGQGGSGGAFFNGMVSEVIKTNGDPGAGLRLATIQYLAAKWGVTI